MKKIYNIGLDIGTTSVGWSATDENNTLLKHKKKNMWGVRLFEEAKTAQERRLQRSTRRRLQRRRERISLLQGFIAEDIEKIDKNFYRRLQESFLYIEDREDNFNKSNLIVGNNYNDKEFYKDYPTIYHLRNKLINNEEKEDIRLVYLAIHHIIKYRGNFLYEGQNFKNILGSINKSYEKLKNSLSESEEDIELNIEVKDLELVLIDKNLSRKEKLEKLLLINGNKSKKQVKEIFNAILGLKANYKNLFLEKEFDLDVKECTISFRDEEADEKLEKLNEILLDEYEIIENIRALYNWNMLNHVLQGKNYISQGKVYLYEKYKKELKELKEIIKKYDRKFYRSLFKNKDEKDISYFTYVKNKDKAQGSNSTYGLKFYEMIKNFINKHINDDFMQKEKEYILNEIEKDNYLIIQNTKDNGQIPYQLNKIELELILKNQSKYYKKLDENKEKIISLLEFRIPYYVGPLNLKSSFGWLVKKEGMEKEKIYPWKLNEIIDEFKTAEEFIKRMTNKCTYLTKEDVMPRNSLLFSEYMYYNEINKIRINGNQLDKYAIQNLMKDVFLKHKKVSENKIEQWAQANLQSINNKYKVDGLQKDKEAATSLAPFIDFMKILDIGIDELMNKENKEMVENIIEWITIFEDKKILKKKIEKEYPKLKETKALDKILSLRYKGWSRLSKKLINELYIYDNYQSRRTILDCLKNGYGKYTNLNFMQIINKEEIGFKEKIENENKIQKDLKISYKDLVQDIQGSPAIKRAVWQSIKIVEEIIKIKGYYPESIFIEFAREDQESKRTKSRNKLVNDIYSKIEQNEFLSNQDIKKLKSKLGKDELKNIKRYLYFMQLGKCMYSGQTIEIENLDNYEVDHIVYRSLIKDDSIDNLVLVRKEDNQKRSNQQMPLAYIKENKSNWQETKNRWEFLKDKGLISAKKFNNLNREFISRNEIEGFINRQLVETRQISKHVANLLTNIYKEKSNIVTVKAGLVSDFRSKYDIYKVREINDYHHGHDAFLASAIGNYIQRRFKKLESEFIYSEYNKLSNTFREKGKYKYGFILGSMNKDYEEDGTLIWDKDQSISLIKKQLDYKDMFITKRVSEGKGQFYNDTLRGKNDKHNIDVRIPIKKNLDVMKYGYYEGEQIAYFSIINYKECKIKRGKEEDILKKELVGIPIRIASSIKNNDDLKNYLQKSYKDVCILKNKIYKNQLIKNEQGLFYITSSSEWNNAKQLLLSKEVIKIINNMQIPKYFDEISEYQLDDIYSKIVKKSMEEYSIFEKIYVNIEDKKDEFIKLNKEDKIKVLLEILKITKANATNGNLKLIKLADRVGRLAGKSLRIEKTSFIFQSVTGMIEKEVSY